jgi:hypothetical protein
MTWIKLDDNAVDHPKIASLSDRAFRWWMRGLSYASRFLTDGSLPPTFWKQTPKQTRAELSGRKLWDWVDPNFHIHDYLEHQTSRESVEKERIRNRNRRKGDRPDDAGCTDGTTAGTTGEKPPPENRDQSAEVKTTVTYGGADAAKYPQAVEKSEKASDWKRAIAITHAVIEADPKRPEGWLEEVKTRLQEQHIDPRQRCQRGGQLFAEAVEYVIKVRKDRKAS